MHNQPPDIKGFGKLKCNGKNLEGSIQEETERIWQDDNDFYINILHKLISTHVTFDMERIAAKIDSIIEKRRNNPQKIALVNQDITPENIMGNKEMIKNRLELCLNQLESLCIDLG